MTRELLILKLGGAAITDKSSEQTLQKDVISRLMEEITVIDTPLVIIHGAGSFAHNYAKKYNLRDGYDADIGMVSQIRGISKIRTSMQILHLALLKMANSNGIDTFSLPISAVMISNGKQDVESSFLDPFIHALDNNLVPISYGDMCFDTKTRFRVVSGDRIIYLLSKFLKNYDIRVVFGSDVTGLYDKDPKNKDAQLIPAINYDEIDSYIKLAGPSAGVDVTGGMKGKLEQIKSISTYVNRIDIIDITVPDRLKNLISGKKVIGTKIID